MTYEMTIFNKDYKLRPCPYVGEPGFEAADAQAHAFFVCWMADFDRETLEFVGRKLSPLALQIVRWGVFELKRAQLKAVDCVMIDQSGSSADCELQLALAQYADDGCRLVDDNSPTFTSCFRKGISNEP